jgi:putative AlgH/UPF0301 family transcriptional regulator
MGEPQKFLKGKLLLDSGDLGGSFFQHTVILVCEHNSDGAFGLVLNRALGKTVGEMIVADLPDTLKESPLFLGGPVQPAALSFLHTDNFMPTCCRTSHSAIRSTNLWMSANPFRQRKKSGSLPVTPAGVRDSSKKN